LQRLHFLFCLFYPLPLLSCLLLAKEACLFEAFLLIFLVPSSASSCSPASCSCLARARSKGEKVAIFCFSCLLCEACLFEAIFININKNNHQNEASTPSASCYFVFLFPCPLLHSRSSPRLPS
jgi:hypothetical protein